MVSAAALTLAAKAVIPYNATNIGFVYLLYVLIIASVWGVASALAASVIATLTLNFYFLPPVGTFSIQIRKTGSRCVPF